jgi:hypothetical protein
LHGNDEDYSPPRINQIHDLDKPCEDDFWHDDGKCVASPEILPIDPDDVQYVIDHDSEYYDSEYYDSEYILDDGLIYNLPSTVNLNKVLLIGKPLTIYNFYDVNPDHRGSNHCKIFLEYYPEQHITLPITLYELAIVYYRAKGNKFDKNYEMYCGIKKNKYGKYEIQMDHGS